MRSGSLFKCFAVAWLLIVQPLSAQGLDERVCDRHGQCLSVLQTATYRQAQAHIDIENWQAANDLLGQLYVQVLESESQLTFSLVNNYALTLAKVGQPAVAALILEKYFKELEEIGVGFENLTRIYGYLADANEYGVTGDVDLLLVEPRFRAQANPAGVVSNRVSSMTNPPSAGNSTDELLSRAVEPGVKEDVTAKLERYFERWEAGDVEGYLSFYTPGHSPDDVLSYSQWTAQRRSRINPERQIRLVISDLDIQRQSDGMVVTEYTQEYRSRSYSDTSRKRLYWTEANDQSWTIWREVSLP